jgi:hypothetical protein
MDQLWEIHGVGGPLPTSHSSYAADIIHARWLWLPTSARTGALAAGKARRQFLPPSANARAVSC